MLLKEAFRSGKRAAVEATVQASKGAA